MSKAFNNSYSYFLWWQLNDPTIWVAFSALAEIVIGVEQISEYCNPTHAQDFTF